MNQLNLQQNAYAFSEEIRGSVSISDQKDPVVCPKPRRLGVLSNNPMRRLRWHASYQAEACDSRAAAELLDIILMKESYEAEKSAKQMASSPPRFFCGSPPSRATNPLILDARFGEENLYPLAALPTSSPSSVSSPSSAHKGGCARMKFGIKPAAVRVEGFDCHNRDRQNSSITAVA